MAHFKPFARAKAGPPSHRSSSRRSYEDDDNYDDDRKYRRYDRGLLGGLLGL